MNRALPPLSLWRAFPKPGSTVLEIAGTVASIHGVTLADILSTRRGEPIISARFAVYAACRKAGFSYPQIGRRLGRDHSSVISGERRHYELMEAAG